jgi:hypothetical protein
MSQRVKGLILHAKSKRDIQPCLARLPVPGGCPGWLSRIMGGMLYAAALVIHSWVRWIVIVTGLVAAGRGIAGRVGNRRWTRTDDHSATWFTAALDLQMTVGLIIYFFSPLTWAALRDVGSAMRDATLRFYAIEHAVGMIVAVVLAHIGQRRIRKATVDARRHTAAAIFFTIALIIILASIPWPNRPFGRPLLRW